jgi:hypothetical protein
MLGETESTTKRFRVRERVVAAITLAALTVACDDGQVRFSTQLRRKTTIDPCKPPAGTGNKCTDWKDVFAILDKPAPAANCTGLGCHDEKTKGGGVVIPKDASGAYDALSKFISGGRPYLQAGWKKDDPYPPYMMCNLTGDPQIGAQMPIAPNTIDPADMRKIGEWFCCGMEKTTGKPGAYCEGGGGGAQGVGGGGGAGGMGGAGGGG